jgi:hypothetical protein
MFFFKKKLEVPINGEHPKVNLSFINYILKKIIQFFKLNINNIF